MICNFFDTVINVSSRFFMFEKIQFQYRSLFNGCISILFIKLIHCLVRNAKRAEIKNDVTQSNFPHSRCIILWNLLFAQQQHMCAARCIIVHTLIGRQMSSSINVQRVFLSRIEWCEMYTGSLSYATSVVAQWKDAHSHAN